ncbi:MAG TPA: FMN-binding negative transcriptional regulator [Pirellulales bacterium]|jgi:transcriptional regulator
MYIPPPFAEQNVSRLHAFIEQNSFGLLVTREQGAPVASHLPFLLDRSVGERGCLVGHMARANPQWKGTAGQMTLVVFSGPHSYISPTWYEAPKTVPTWNYAAVHATGPLEIIEAPGELLDILHATVARYEGRMPNPWSFDKVDIFIEQMVQQIVGFRIEIRSLEGKWKLNQNHPAERRKKVIRALRELSDENSQAIATLMEETLPHEKRQ